MELKVKKGLEQMKESMQQHQMRKETVQPKSRIVIIYSMHPHVVPHV